MCSLLRISELYINREYFVATNAVGSDLGANFINDENVHLEIFLISIRFREETAIFKMLSTYSNVLTSSVVHTYVNYE